MKNILIILLFFSGFVSAQDNEPTFASVCCEAETAEPVTLSIVGDEISLDNGTPPIKIRQCVQIWGEDSGATAPNTYDYSFGNGNELTTTTNNNWGVMMLHDGEIVSWGFTVNNPVVATQRLVLTLDETLQTTLTALAGSDEEIQATGLNIPVTQGQVLNWYTQTGNAVDVVPTALVCYDID